MKFFNRLFHRCTFDSTKWKKLGESKISQYVPVPSDAWFWTIGTKRDFDPFKEVQKGTDVTYTNTCLTCGLRHSKTIRY
jgi:hypothetical protein